MTLAVAALAQMSVVSKPADRAKPRRVSRARSNSRPRDRGENTVPTGHPSRRAASALVWFSKCPRRRRMRNAQVQECSASLFVADNC